MIQERRQIVLENLIYFIIWMILFVAPVLGFKYGSDTTIEWSEVFHSWKMLAPFFVLFLFNNYVFIPFLLLRKRTWLYLLFVIALTGIIFSMNPFLVRSVMSNDREHIIRQGEERPGGLHPDESRPDKFQQGEPQPLQHRDGPPQYMPQPEERRRSDLTEHPPPVMRRGPGPHDPFFFLMSPLLKFLMMAMLVIGINVAIKLMFRLLREGQRMKDLERQTLQTELEYLKHQINPHFFMNTLNNIHALIDIDTEKAKETVLDLSKMMRYVLYDTEQSKLPLEKEIQFLSNYVELMKLRYTDQVDIQIKFPGSIPKVQVPPLLFISFLENAFKHGVSYQHKSYIYFSIEMIDNMLECKIENSKIGNGQMQQDSGIGLENVKKRLRLLYNDNYTLSIQDGKDDFKVLLIIPV